MEHDTDVGSDGCEPYGEDEGGGGGSDGEHEGRDALTVGTRAAVASTATPAPAVPAAAAAGAAGAADGVSTVAADHWNRSHKFIDDGGSPSRVENLQEPISGAAAKKRRTLSQGDSSSLPAQQRLALPVHASKPAALPAAAATPPFKLPWSGGATRPSPQCHGAACPREGSRGRGGGQNAAAEAAGTAAAAAAGAAPALSFASALRQVHRPL